ncbi:MAG: 1,4-dihydroxy-2-naphthoate polyprenyltransferase [Pseudonocardiales bacterium]|nr:1,4-dihydroxy-2-naphthoate polyprenyltransferase [Pseudonocardiales bacterium]
MATPAQWVEGARPRTLPAAVSPVLAGTGVAVAADAFVWWKALLALVVALALQVAVNYANDYSDGIRGTDANRVGPLRLVGSGTAAASQVRRAAILCFGLAGVAGLVLAATTSWWLVAVGGVAMVAAWFYTGGATPYGYRALGEVSVFVFFGLVAVVGTSYVQTEALTTGAWWAGAGIGALACAILVANNLRDIPSDTAVGKRTLAVVVGDRGSRILYGALLLAAVVALVGVGATVTWWALLGLVAAGLAVRALAAVWRGTTGPALVPVLRDTGLTELVYATGLLVGCLVSAAG